MQIEWSEKYEKPKYENYMSHNTADERRKEKVINSFKNYRRTNSWDSECVTEDILTGNDGKVDELCKMLQRLMK